MNNKQSASVTSALGIPMQDTSIDIWNTKYRLQSKDGQPVDQTIDDTLVRVAKALAAVEQPAEQQKWEQEFIWALRNGAVPAGRIVSNAGAEAYKPATSTINCTVSGTIPDSMDGILGKVHEAGLTLKAGCGIGYCFSTLRPRNAWVSGAGAKTSGPLSFMDIYDKMCFTISSAGGRRGAQMATFDVGHPDVLDFIRAKREDGRLRQFNLSLLITKDFIKAVENDGQWHLHFPITPKEAQTDAVNLQDPEQVLWREWPITDGYVTDDSGLVACRIYKSLPARRLWDMIMASTYDYAEPGFILIDEVNEMNNNWFCEYIQASNPCAEQMLPPYGSCLLGSVNLTHFIRNPFTSQASFDWDKYAKVIRIFTRMLDNVVEINGLPLEQQRAEIISKRRHGMGYLGLGSAMTMLQMPYGSPESVEFTDKVSREMALEGWREGLNLAKEKKPAPILDNVFTVTAEMLRKRPEMQSDGYKLGDRVKGSILHARYSRYMQRIADLDPELINAMCEHGTRFTHHTSIAPTGTIALSLGNNVSNGIEPSFSHYYSRNVIREGRSTKEQVDVFSFEVLAYRALINKHAGRDLIEGIPSIEVVDGLTRDLNSDEQCAILRDTLEGFQKDIQSILNVRTTITIPHHADPKALRALLVKAIEQHKDDYLAAITLPTYFVTAESITPTQHVDVQAAAQRWVDSSISKTANVPTDYPYEDFKGIYRYAVEKGLKGCTTFRFNPENFSGVLVKKQDLENTLYTFELEDGSSIQVKGSDRIEYEGETHVASNLFDALKEGYYGKL